MVLCFGSVLSRTGLSGEKAMFLLFFFKNYFFKKFNLRLVVFCNLSTKVWKGLLNDITYEFHSTVFKVGYHLKCFDEQIKRQLLLKLGFTVNKF